MVRAMFAALGWPVSEHPGRPGEQYNCGQSKNAGVHATPGIPEDVFVLADADCVTTAATLREAVWLAYQAPGVVWTGDSIRILDRDTTERITSWEGAAAETPYGEVRPADSTPQLLTIRRDFFDRVGGYDEAYVGYGFEDYDFRQRCAALAPLRAAHGTIVHLWHEPDREKVEPGELYEANRARWLAAGGIPWQP